MDRSLALVLTAALGALAIVAGACSSSDPAAPDTNRPVTQLPTVDSGPPNESEDAAGPEPVTDAGHHDAGHNDNDAAPADGGKDAEADAGSLTAYTKAEVQTLFNSECSPCHTTNSAGGLNLASDFTTKTINVTASQSALKLIKPGDRTKSYLYLKLEGTQASGGGGGGRMPKNDAPLTDTELARIGAYIDALP